MHVLVVDDHEENLYFLETLLKAHGYTSDSALDGVEALDKLKKNKYDIIISDILMPRMDGYQFCSNVKKNPLFRDIVFVFFTATYTSAKDRELALKLGADNFFTKPCEPEVLLNELKKTYLKFHSQKHDSESKADNEKEILKLYNERLIDKLERKMLQLEREVEKRKEIEEELVEKNQELEQFIYITSHDLKTPLINIQGFSMEIQKSMKMASNLLNQLGDDKKSPEREELLKKLDKILEHELHQSFDFIKSSIDRMDNLIKGVTDFSRHRHLSVKSEIINMNSLIQTILKNFEYVICNKKIKLTIGNLPDCSSDEYLLRFVFKNLIDNAIKFSMEKTAPQITISGKKVYEEFVYSVTDNGIGINENIQDRIFELFYKIDPKKSEGRGISLPLVKKILRRLKGKIWVESTYGGGSTFHVSLPCRNKET